MPSWHNFSNGLWDNAMKGLTITSCPTYSAPVPYLKCESCTWFYCNQFYLNLIYMFPQRKPLFCDFCCFLAELWTSALWFSQHIQLSSQCSWQRPRHDKMENVFCEGCAEKEIQVLVTQTSSLLTGATVWLQVNERIAMDLPHFVLLWCFLTECQMWSLFKWCPAFRFYLSHTQYDMQAVKCLGDQQRP